MRPKPQPFNLSLTERESKNEKLLEHAIKTSNSSIDLSQCCVDELRQLARQSEIDADDIERALEEQGSEIAGPLAGAEIKAKVAAMRHTASVYSTIVFLLEQRESYLDKLH